jgi:hypothetical protein
VQAGGVSNRAGTTLPERPNFFLRTIRPAIGKYERLLEAEDGGGTAAGECLGLYLVKPAVVVEHADHRATAVASLDT